MLPRAPAGVDSEYRYRSSANERQLERHFATPRHRLKPPATPLGFSSPSFPACPICPCFALPAFYEYRLPSR